MILVEFLRFLTPMLALIALLIADAQAVMISPIPVEFKTNQRVVTFTVEATDETEKGKVFEAKVYKWNVKDNAYLETQDIVVYPVAQKLNARFKLALKERLDKDKEHTYRLVVKENSEEKDGIRFLMAYDIPIFIFPKKEVVDFEVLCGQNVEVLNKGNRTIKITEIDGEGTVLYVAAGDTKKIQGKAIKIDKTYCQEVNL